VGAGASEKASVRKPWVVATVQTLLRKPLFVKPRQTVGLVVVDLVEELVATQWVSAKVVREVDEGVEGGGGAEGQGAVVGVMTGVHNPPRAIDACHPWRVHESMQSALCF